MILKNGGVIGQQGTQTGTASDNEWLGSAFTGTNYGIFTFSSQAIQSPIVRRSTPTQFDPPNLWGNPSPQSYVGGNGLIIYTGSSIFSCGTTYTQMPTIAVPEEDDYESDDIYYIAKTSVYRQLHINSDLRNAHTEYMDFHSLFESTAMETLA